ncbi:MAG: hypothetical protein IIY62_01725, partial [Kiritimatiellae bacterium]|nr:hypothetical protein [Kiritimatiellia bacterium]
TARGGDDAAGIGGGSGGASGRYRQRGGTVVARGAGGGKDIGPGSGGSAASSSYAVILGGSLDSYSDRLSPAAKNASDALLYCVTVPTGRPNLDIGAVMGDFNGYSLNGVVTDDEGKIYIWLPNGEYHINIGTKPFRATVDGADTVAEEWYVGVEVNGADIALQSGAGWAYDIPSKVLSVFADGCTVSGTNTEGGVSLQFTNSVSAVFSDLVVGMTSSSPLSPVSVASNATVALTIAGNNRFSGSGECAGINVPYGATLSITNLDAEVSVPDLDNIYVYTNILYDIEYDEAGNPVVDPATGCVVTNGIVYDVHYVTNYVTQIVSPGLWASGARNGAGIGGSSGQSHGTIEVFGGVIEALSAEGAAGIGSGFFPDSQADDSSVTLRRGIVRIGGGDVTATGGQHGAGIGGGNQHTGGIVEISGGRVTATGGSGASGIGAGWGARGHTITISGGEVVANSGSGGAGIGGGSREYSILANSTPCQIAISGGRVRANAASGGGAGIGSGYDDTQTAAVNITGGTVEASGSGAVYSYTQPDDIGAAAHDTAWDVMKYALTIRGASVHAMHRTASIERVSPDPSNGAERVWCVTVDTAKPNEVVRIENLPGFDGGAEGGGGLYADADGKVYLWLPNGTHVFYVDNQPRIATVDNADATAELWLTGVLVDGVDAAYREVGGQMWYYDVEERRLYIGGDHVVSGTNTTGDVSILAGPYEGAESTGGGADAMLFTLSNLCLRATSAAPLITTNGTVTVRLAGINTLDASAAENMPGLFVGATSALVVTNLHEGAKVVARGGSYAAGIGGGKLKAGDISIAGGIVDALGGEYAAGIGGGFQRGFGTIRVSGGEVTAESPSGGAGIGSGRLAAGGTIEISGGVVNATGNTTGAGIGSGGFLNNSVPGSAGTIRISGGVVTARSVSNSSGTGGAGIGGGYMCKGGNITITGGRVAAFGGERGAGIGGGSGQPAERIEISGGTVSPTGGSDAKAIGHGYNPSGNLGVIVITGGSVTTFLSRTAPAPVNASGAAVYPVRFTDLTPNAPVELDVPGYGLNDVYADASGSVSIWLAPGEYYCSVDGRRYAVQMSNGTATIARIPDAYGVQVDGVDVAALSGDHWLYNPFSNWLTVSNSCVITGRRMDGEVGIAVDAADDCTLTISNLYLQAVYGSAIYVASGNVTLCLAGTNTLDAADVEDYPALRVGFGQRVAITNLHEGAKLVAIGGAKAAGIGADNLSYAGTIEIDGGIVEAKGGSHGAGIGGSWKYGFYEIDIHGGTVRPVAGSGSRAIGLGPDVVNYAGDGKIVITGGSVAAAAADVQPSVYTVNADGTRVYPVEIPGFTPNAKVDMEIDGYSTDGIYADAGGKIYPWLRERDYLFMLNGVPHLAHVTKSGAAATPWLAGVTADGTDVAYLHDESGKWEYDFEDLTLHILSGSSPDDCVTVEGTNTESYVHIATTSDVYFKISDLHIATSNAAPIGVRGGNAVVAFSGTNTLDASGARRNGPAGIQVNNSYEMPTSLTLTNLQQTAAIVAKGGAAAAGIGGKSTSSSGPVDISIYGGIITATTDITAAGIGGGAGGSARVKIYGGDITAVGGTSGGAGIGGGRSGKGEVHIYGGTIDARGSSSGAAGIGGGSDGDGTVYISGGVVKALAYGQGMVIGAGGFALGYVHISGGTVMPMITSAYDVSKIIGGRNGGEVRFTGGSVDVALAMVTPAAMNDNGVAVFPVTVSNLTAHAKVAFDGLPSYYGTTDVYANDEGKVYLWLPENWDEGGITPRLLGAAPKSVTTHTFAANGYRYTVAIPEGGGEPTAERGEALQLDALRIRDFAVDGGWLYIGVTANPATWLQGFADRLRVRAARSLPIPDTDDSLLDLSHAELWLEDGKNATIAVPLPDGASGGFFRIEA